MVVEYLRWWYIAEIMAENMKRQRPVLLFLYKAAYQYKPLPCHMLQNKKWLWRRSTVNSLPSSSKSAQNTSLHSVLPLLNTSACFTAVRAQGASYSICTSSAGSVPHNDSAASWGCGNSNIFLDAEEPDFNLAQWKEERGNRRWRQMRAV